MNRSSENRYNLYGLLFEQAASPACTELEAVVMDWLGEY